MKLLLNILIFFIIISCSLAQNRYELPAKANLVYASRDSLKRQIGTTELTGRNDGEVKKYWSLFSETPIPYCAAGQYWVYYRACLALGLPLSDVPILRTALANAIYDDAKRHGIKTAYTPKIDDLIVWIKPNTYNGHIERIIEVKLGGWVVTIGFNTGSGDAREGDGVWLKKRNIKHVLSRMRVRGLIGFRLE